MTIEINRNKERQIENIRFLIMDKNHIFNQ